MQFPDIQSIHPMFSFLRCYISSSDGVMHNSFSSETIKLALRDRFYSVTEENGVNTFPEKWTSATTSPPPPQPPNNQLQSAKYIENWQMI